YNFSPTPSNPTTNAFTSLFSTPFSPIPPNPSSQSIFSTTPLNPTTNAFTSLFSTPFSPPNPSSQSIFSATPSNPSSNASTPLFSSTFSFDPPNPSRQSISSATPSNPTNNASTPPFCPFPPNPKSGFHRTFGFHCACCPNTSAASRLCPRSSTHYTIAEDIKSISEIPKHSRVESGMTNSRVECGVSNKRVKSGVNNWIGLVSQRGLRGCHFCDTLFIFVMIFTPDLASIHHQVVLLLHQGMLQILDQLVLLHHQDHHHLLLLHKVGLCLHFLLAPHSLDHHVPLELYLHLSVSDKVPPLHELGKLSNTL
ncbi:hypothetical protein Tsubulata_015274, partial [Turnera subulata]